MTPLYFNLRARLPSRKCVKDLPTHRVKAVMELTTGRYLRTGTVFNGPNPSLCTVENSCSRVCKSAGGQHEHSTRYDTGSGDSDGRLGLLRAGGHNSIRPDRTGWATLCKTYGSGQPTHRQPLLKQPALGHCSCRASHSICRWLCSRASRNGFPNSRFKILPAQRAAFDNGDARRGSVTALHRDSPI